jgi:hypothetical protein
MQDGSKIQTHLQVNRKIPHPASCGQKRFVLGEAEPTRCAALVDGSSRFIIRRFLLHALLKSSATVHEA